MEPPLAPPIEPERCCVPTGPSEPVPIEPLLPRLLPPMPPVEPEEPEPVIEPLPVVEPLEPLEPALLLSTPPMPPQPSWLLSVQGGLVWFELVVEPALLAAGLPEIELLSAAKAGAAIRARAVAAPIIRLFITIPFAVPPIDASLPAVGRPWFGDIEFRIRGLTPTGSWAMSRKPLAGSVSVFHATNSDGPE